MRRYLILTSSSSKIRNIPLLVNRIKIVVGHSIPKSVPESNPKIYFRVPFRLLIVALVFPRKLLTFGPLKLGRPENIEESIVNFEILTGSFCEYTPIFPFRGMGNPEPKFTVDIILVELVWNSVEELRKALFLDLRSIPLVFSLLAGRFCWPPFLEEGWKSSLAKNLNLHFIVVRSDHRWNCCSVPKGWVCLRIESNFGWWSCFRHSGYICLCNLDSFTLLWIRLLVNRLPLNNKSINWFCFRTLYDRDFIREWLTPGGLFSWF